MGSKHTSKRSGEEADYLNHLARSLPKSAENKRQKREKERRGIRVFVIAAAVLQNIIL